MVEHEHLRGLSAAAGRLIEAARVPAAGLGCAEVLLAADLRPELLGWLEGKVTQRSVARRGRPLADALEVGLFFGREEIPSVTDRSGKACGADVVLPPLEQDGLEVLSDHTPDQWDILVQKLLLQVDGVCADEGLAARPPRMQNGGKEVGEGFAHASSGLHDQMRAPLKGGGHTFGHLLLLGTPFKTADRRQAPLGPKELRHLLGKAPRGS